MSVYSVTRRVDTVIVEMDELTAHKVYALIMRAYDDTLYPGDLTELAIMLFRDAEINERREFKTNIEGEFVRLSDLERV